MDIRNHRPINLAALKRHCEEVWILQTSNYKMKSNGHRQRGRKRAKSLEKREKILLVKQQWNMLVIL